MSEGAASNPQASDPRLAKSFHSSWRLCDLTSLPHEITGADLQTVVPEDAVGNGGVEIEAGHREVHKVVGRSHRHLALPNREGDVLIGHALHFVWIDLLECFDRAADQGLQICEGGLIVAHFCRFRAG